MDMKRLLFSFEGRVNRAPFWGYAIASMILMAMVGASLQSQASTAINVLCIALLWPALAVQTKRWHDRGKSAWFLLVNLIPLVGGLWVLIECGCLRGTDGANRFGADPLAGGGAAATAEDHA